MNPPPWPPRCAAHQPIGCPGQPCPLYSKQEIHTCFLAVVDLKGIECRTKGSKQRIALPASLSASTALGQGRHQPDQKHPQQGRQPAHRCGARPKQGRPELEQPVIARRVNIGGGGGGNLAVRAGQHRPGIAFVVPQRRTLQLVETQRCSQHQHSPQPRQCGAMEPPPPPACLRRAHGRSFQR